MSSDSKTIVTRWLVIAAFLGIFAFQAIHLDGDPSPMKRISDVGDEGYWQHNARGMSLFHTLLPDELNMALVGAPLFTAVQYGVFSLFGTSLVTARIVSLVSSWLILLLFYRLMRANFSAGKALVAAAALGLSHEMLMYAKWSTPILMEACFLTAVLYFWELAKRGNSRWMALSAGCLMAAMATKLSSIFFSLPIVLFVAGEYLLRKNIDRRRLMIFLGAVVAFGSVLLTLAMLNYEQFAFFARTIGKLNVSKGLASGDIIHGPVDVLCNVFFSFPGVSILRMLAFLWLLDFVANAFKQGAAAAIRSMPTVEFYSACWLVGSLTLLVFSPEKMDRRFVMFLVPLAILAMSFVFRAWECFSKKGTGAASGMLAAPLDVRVVACLLTVCAWSLYARDAVMLFEQRWLARVGLSFPAWGYAVAAVCCVALPVVLWILRKPRIATAALLAVFFAVSLTLDAVWYGTQTTTLRDTSRLLASYGGKGEYLVGPWGHELALENSLHPIWCTSWAIAPMNDWIDDAGDREGQLLITLNIFEGEPRGNLGDKAVEKFSPNRREMLAELRLCPIAFSQVFQFEGKLWRIRPKEISSNDAVPHNSKNWKTMQRRVVQ
jgi:hypothetical protein